MTAHRPAARLWAKAEQERQLVRDVQEAEWRRRMLSAGHIDTYQLSDQARRILAWLAEWDDWTVDGVTELLAAAHRSGRHASRPTPSPRPTSTTVPEREASTTDHRAVESEHVPTADHDTAETAAAATGARPLPPPVGHDPVRARLAARGRRPENPAVGL